MNSISTIRDCVHTLLGEQNVDMEVEDACVRYNFTPMYPDPMIQPKDLYMYMHRSKHLATPVLYNYESGLNW